MNLAMNTDLTCLVALALWSLVLNHTPALARIAKGGVAWGLGNRETMPEVPEWVGRADRAQRNHHDNLAMIATVILVAQVTGHANAATANASIAILAFRVLHWVGYCLGIGPLRILGYAGSIAAMLSIVTELFKS
jgi:uncharacterized MAPEG superfamily protein